MTDGRRLGVIHAFGIPVLLLALAASAAPVWAQSQEPGLPPGVYMGKPDYKLAPAGTYALDPYHTAVIARVSHIGYSYSVFRFDRVAGTLTWDPGNAAACSLTAQVETASITTNVKGFAEQLAGDEFLKARAFPEARFVSSAFRQIDARRAKVDGQLTLMGKTKPVTFEVELVGAGKGYMDQPRIGVNARTSLKPVDFGLPAILGDAIEIVIDTEFQRNK